MKKRPWRSRSGNFRGVRFVGTGGKTVRVELSKLSQNLLVHENFLRNKQEVRN